MRKLTTEEFIERSIKTHGNKYGYDLTVYVKSEDKVKIKCNRCGDYFSQPAKKHMSGQGCPKSSCGGTQQLTHDEFVKKARDKHGDKYDYIEKYINSRTEIDISCADCGNVINISPNTHLSGKGGCSFCNGGSQSNKENFVRKAMLSHKKGHYSYDKFIYVKAKINGEIFCNIHKEYFPCAPYNHLAGFKNGKMVRKGKGCPRCGRMATIAASLKPFNTFLKEARIIHGVTYEYDPDSYNGVKEKMNIYCYKHGWFPQRPDDHTNAKQGCSKCKSSHGEREVRKILKILSVNFKEEFNINECRNKRTLPFDFAVFNKQNQLKGLIEFHGQQHFKSITLYENSNDGYFGRNRSDQIKSDFCEFNKIPFLVIEGTKTKIIKAAIEKFLKSIRNKKPITKFEQPPQLNIFQV